MIEYRIFECEDGNFKVQQRIDEGEWMAASPGIFAKSYEAQRYIDSQKFADSINQNNTSLSDIIEDGWKVESMDEEPAYET